MTRRILIVILSLNLICFLVACGEAGQQDTAPFDTSENSSYESVDGKAAMKRTIDGLRGYLDCLPGAKEMGVIYGAGAWQLGDIQGNPAMEEAYKMGKNIC